MVGVTLMFGVMAYVGMPLIDSYTSYGQTLTLLWFFPAIVPSMLLLFLFFIFEEQCNIPAWMLALVSVSIGGSLWFIVLGDGLAWSPLWLQILKLIITVVAIGVIWSGRDADLVEVRAKARIAFVLVLAVTTLMVLSLEIATGYNPPLLLDTFAQFEIFSITLAINFFTARLNPKGHLMSPPVVAKTDAAKAQDPVIVELLERMREERLYADHDLRVGTLAKILNTPEYKLRQKINQELGYRNFNQFVNHYRIEEAGVKLIEESRTPVLTIAIDVGFRSISSFNTAFQAHFGLSPTKFRAESA